MAYSSKFFLASLLASMTISMVSAQILPTEVSQLDVLGRLVCTPSGNVVPAGVPSPGIGGVNVHVTCNNGTIDLGTLTTNVTGFFDGVLTAVDGVLFHPSTCVATVTLPVAECTILPATGVLYSVLGVGGLIDTLLGSGLVQLLAGTWTLVAV